jgi:hypothetical protein
MALAPITKRPVIGSFTNECGVRFDYTVADTSWTGRLCEGEDINVEIFMCDGSTRFARMLKTVIYVIVDENDDGSPVLEKWKIKKHHWKREG